MHGAAHRLHNPPTLWTEANSKRLYATIAILIYAAAMTAANHRHCHFGPWVSPINAFIVLIGLDLALRDWLHVRLKAWRMLALIGATGALTYALNNAAGMISIASSVAFTSAALVDWATFARLRGSWLYRANRSNVAGAAVNGCSSRRWHSGAAPGIVALQFVAKAAGGAIWSVLLGARCNEHIKPTRLRHDRNRHDMDRRPHADRPRRRSPLDAIQTARHIANLHRLDLRGRREYSGRYERAHGLKPRLALQDAFAADWEARRKA